jgi:hypothetical protein
MDTLVEKIWCLKGQKDFEHVALEVFGYQYRSNAVYKKYCDSLHTGPDKIEGIADIPFMPIGFFKSHDITSVGGPFQKIYTSSGTTGENVSRHLVKDVKIYRESSLRAFEMFYGPVSGYCILALLPSYLERGGSSLVEMAACFMEKGSDPDGGFFMNDFEKLNRILLRKEKEGKKTLLLGVSFGLLDFVGKYTFRLKNTIVMETGGMKGRRKELTRQELHHLLCQGFGVEGIHSEYGMTELLSQAYAKGNGLFFAPPWMKVLIRDQYDPFHYLGTGRTGGINVIDLANVQSCSFIETKDLGRFHNNGGFEVLGRFDNSDIRGCNLMVG